MPATDAGQVCLVGSALAFLAPTCTRCSAQEVCTVLPGAHLQCAVCPSQSMSHHC